MTIQRFTLLLALLCCTYHPVTAQTTAADRIDSLHRTGYHREMIDLWNSQPPTLQNDTLRYIDLVLKLAGAKKGTRDMPGATATLNSIQPLLPPGSVAEARWWYEYAQIESLNGNYELADSLIQAALTQIERSGQKNTLFYLRGMELLARNHIQYYDNDTAIAIYLDAIAQWKAAGIAEHWQLGGIYQGLQSAYYNKGQVHQCLRYAETGMEIFGRTAAPYFPAVLFLRRIQADCYIYLRDMPAAGAVIDWLKTNSEAGYGKQSDFYAVALQKEASYLGGLERLDAALQATQEAAAIRRALHASVTQQAIADDLVGDILVQLERFDEARLINQTILDALLALPHRNIHLEGHAWEGLGASETDPNKAIPYFEKAVAHFRQSFNREDCGIDAYLLIQMIEKYLEINQLEAAQRTLATLSPDTSFAGIWDENYRDYLIFKGILNARQGNEQAALIAWHTLVQTQCDLSASELFLGTEFQQLEQTQTLHKISDLLLTRASMPAASANLQTLAFEFQCFLKSLLLTTAQKTRQNIRSGSDMALTNDFERLTERREYLVWCYGQTKADLADQNIQIEAVERQVDSLELRLSRSTADFTLPQLRQPFSWQDLRAQLLPDEAAIQIVRYRTYNIKRTDSIGYTAFLILPNQTAPVVISFPNATGLEDILFEKYINQCALPTGKGRTDDWYTAFWQYFEPHLNGSVKKIYLSADGVLHKINAGAIRLPDGSYVADRYDIRPVFSLKQIHSIADQPLSGNQFTALLVGNPDFLTTTAAPMRPVTPQNTDLSAMSDTRGLRLQPLPHSATEVRDLAALLRKKGWQTTVFTGKNADETSVKLVSHPTVLHLATHGYFLTNTRSGTGGMSRSVLENNPMLRSMLFFAGAQQTLDGKTQPANADDGILTAYEAQNIDLSGTQLVVLSACQTAQGKVQNGEGVYGLQRALRIAGAQALLLSLWDVDDRVGQEFMLLFYTHWLNGQSKTAAFRMAQLAIRAKYPQPFYWAGFVLLQ